MATYEHVRNATYPSENQPARSNRGHRTLPSVGDSGPIAPRATVVPSAPRVLDRAANLAATARPTRYVPNTVRVVPPACMISSPPFTPRKPLFDSNNQ